MASNRSLREEESRWQDEVWGPSVRERPERRSAWQNEAGEILPVYTPADLDAQGFDYLKDLGFPGEFPFTRGFAPSGYRHELVTVSAYAGYGTPEDTNLRYKKLLEFGADGVGIAMDLPTQLGYDSDHIMSRGEVGLVGVSINTLRDMEVVFDGIPLNSFKLVSSTANAVGPIILAMLVAVGEKQGLERSQYTVRLQNDVLKEYSARGTQIFPMRPAVQFTVDAVEWCVREAPNWFPITISGSHIVSAGAPSYAANAFLLANARCYIDETLKRGLSIDEIAPRVYLFPNEREDFFVGLANYRALRRIWARLVRDDYGARDPRSWAARLQGYAHGPWPTRREPLNNIVRITLGALAYYLAGVQDMRSASFDEVSNVPAEESVRTSIRMQQILAHEYGISSTVDPLGGSYYLETLTNQVERKILEVMAKVEAAGGAIGAMEKGYIQETITEGAVRRQRAFQQGERVSVGENLFPSQCEHPDVTFRVDPDVESRQIARLQGVRAERNAERVRLAIDDLVAAARQGANLMPSLLEAVRAYASVGEICSALKTVFGEYKPDRSF